MSVADSALQTDLPREMEEALEGCRDQLELDLRRIASREDVEDALQDALVDFLQRDGSSLRNPGGWLYATARRRAVDRWRETHGRRRDGTHVRQFEPLDVLDEVEAFGNGLGGSDVLDSPQVTRPTPHSGGSRASSNGCSGSSSTA